MSFPFDSTSETVNVNFLATRSSILIKNITRESLKVFCATPSDIEVKGKQFSAFGAQWRLEIRPGGCKKYPGWIAVFLFLDTPDETKTVDFQIRVGKNATKYYSTRFSTCDPQPEGTVRACGSELFISHGTLLRNFTYHVVDGVLAIAVTIFGVKQHFQLSGTVAVPPSSLGSEYLAMLQSGKGADVTLVCGGEKIKAHSLILSHRSPLFAALLDQSSPMACVDLSAMPVLDSITPPTFRRLLEFMYTDELTPNSAEEARSPGDFISRSDAFLSL